VQLAHSFQDALNHIHHTATNHSPFDLILLNIYHSPSDWQEMVTAVRRAACTPDIPIIGVTTLKELNEHKHNVDEYPNIRLLPRPLRQSQLYNTFVDLLIPSPTSTTTAPRPRKQTLQAIAQAVPMRILLAEDNIVNQKIALRLLERFGYRADVAANGIEVIDAITHRPYDLILMDVQMPEMDGIQATQHIRQSIPPSQQPYIIAMTAHALEGDREWCLNAGMDDYIGKPIHVERLVNALQRIQEQIQSSHRSPTQHESGP
jgi:CheY-like chemotaxis protein